MKNKVLSFYLIYKSPIPVLGIEEPSPIMIELDLEYLWILVNIPCFPIIWFQAPVSEVHSVSVMDLSKVRVARACGIASFWVVLFGIYQQILLIWPGFP